MSHITRYIGALCLLAFGLGALVLFPKIALAWFGAGKTPGFGVTSAQLTGEVELPVYKFAPDFYEVGDTLSVYTKITNPSQTNVNTPVFWRLYKVQQAPLGTDVSDGDPGEPGINENDLHTALTSIGIQETLLLSSSLGILSVPSQGTVVATGSALLTQPGYYRFAFSTTETTASVSSGELLTTGFIRVLSASGFPSQTPSPTAAATPSPSPTALPTSVPSPTASPGPTSTPVPGSGKQSKLSLIVPTCSDRNVTAIYEVFLDNQPQSGVVVQLQYGGESKQAQTDSQGKALAVFGYKDAGNVSATADQSYPSQIASLAALPSCPDSSGQVLGTSTIASATRSGQVLGASTFAGTGEAYWPFEVVWMLGSVALSLGLAIYGHQLWREQ